MQIFKTCRCGEAVDYSEENVADVLCIGLADAEIQRDLLSDPNQERAVEQTLRLVEAKEAGRRFASQLSVPQTVEAVGSSYKRLKRPTQKDRAPRDDTCSYCRGAGHGRNAPTKIRRAKCPAFGKARKNCGKDNNLEKVCHSDAVQEAIQYESALFSNGCVLTMLDDHIISTLDHHVPNQSTESWIRRQSKPQPYVRTTEGRHQQG